MRTMKTTVPATPVNMESARTASMSTNVCVPQDTQVGFAKILCVSLKVVTSKNTYNVL